MQTRKFLNRWLAATLLAVGMLTLFALAACGGDESSGVAAGGAAGDPPTQAPVESTATTEPAVPTATPLPEPPAVPMVPATIPEPGSDDEQIMAVLEKQVRAVNTADYESFLETCIPGAKRTMSLKQLKYFFEERRGASVDDVHGTINFSPQGYNLRNVTVKMLRAPYAQADYDVFDYDKHVGLIEYGEEATVTRTFMNLDGQWYSEASPCGAG